LEKIYVLTSQNTQEIILLHLIPTNRFNSQWWRTCLQDWRI